jgi:hypothetical protein
MQLVRVPEERILPGWATPARELILRLDLPHRPRRHRHPPQRVEGIQGLGLRLAAGVGGHGWSQELPASADQNERRDPDQDGEADCIPGLWGVGATQDRQQAAEAAGGLAFNRDEPPSPTGNGLDPAVALVHGDGMEVGGQPFGNQAGQRLTRWRRRSSLAGARRRATRRGRRARTAAGERQDAASENQLRRYSRVLSTRRRCALEAHLDPTRGRHSVTKRRAHRPLLAAHRPGTSGGRPGPPLPTTARRRLGLRRGPGSARSRGDDGR